jgi:spore coat protein U-like protein
MTRRGFIRRALAGILAALAALLLQAPAQAAISCSVSSPGFTAVYSTTAGAPNTGSSTVVISCTRNAGDSQSFGYTLNADNGLNNIVGQTNRARLAPASYINYELYRNAALSQQWGPGGARDFAGTIDFGAGLTRTVTLTYYYRIPALQNRPAGVYFDTVTMSLDYGPVATSAFPVQVNVNATCQLTTAPGDLTFTYSSFQLTPASAITPFAVQCTLNLPYTMTLDQTSGTMLGLTYNLSLSAPPPYLGSGTPQGYTISGSVPANQAGTCGGAVCSATQMRTLTIAY